MTIGSLDDDDDDDVVILLYATGELCTSWMGVSAALTKRRTPR